MCKRLLFTSIFFLAITIGAIAQTIEIIPQTNYTIGGKVYARFGELNIADSESYGLSLNIVPQPNVSFQIEYFYQPTTGEYRDYFDSQFSQNADLNISWFQMGVRRRFQIQEKIVPFAGASIGLTRFDLDSSPTSYDEWALSLALQGGLNVYLSRILGLRFHARLLTPIQFRGFGFYAETEGSGLQASAGSYFIQGDFGAGIVIRLPGGQK